MILNEDHRAMYIPKFHCELNPTEHVWCHAKHYTRSHCDYSFPNLEKIIDTAQDSVIVELIKKIFLVRLGSTKGLTGKETHWEKK